MVYFKRWEEFTQATTLLYQSSPVKTRYCIRYRHATSLLVLKVTDDRQCLKFKTRSSLFLNRFELLNRSLLAQMQARRKPPPPASLVLEKQVEQDSAPTPRMEDSAAEVTTATGTGTGTGTGTTPAKKKKKGKKK